MSIKEIKNIVIIGTGNVGTHLAEAFVNAGCSVKQIVGRNYVVAEKLASSVNASFVTDFAAIEKGHDMYVLALAEKAMEEVLPQLNLDKEFLVHTSGSLSLEILYPYSENTGVFYPLQTFTHGRDVNFREIPILLEANRINNEQQLFELATKLTEQVEHANSEQRLALHIAAVFACNFSNHMFSLARQLANKYKIDFDLLIPLIKETAAKSISMGPEKAQTGPARRKDQKVILKHLELLSDSPRLQDLYARITESIQEQSEFDNDKL